MTIHLVDLDLGTGLADGTTWPNAFQTFQAGLSGMAVGDELRVQGSQTETTSQTLTITGGGAAVARPHIILGVKDGTTNDPVQEADLVTDRNDAAMPVFKATGASQIIWGADFFAKIQGMKFDAGGAIRHTSDNHVIVEECHLLCNILQLGGASSSRIFTALNMKLEATGSPSTFITNFGGPFIWKGGELVGTPGTLIASGGHYQSSRFIGVDLSSMGNNKLVAFGTRPHEVEFDGCEHGTNFVIENDVGDLLDWTTGVKLNLSDSGGVTDPITAFFRRYHMGAVRDETTIVRAGSVGDGVNLWSIKMSPTDNAVIEGHLGLPSIKIAGRIGPEHVGVSCNFDIFIHNTGSDKNTDQVAAEMFIPVNDSAQMERFTTLPNPLASSAAITDDDSLWNGSADFSQRLRITATPDHQGPVTGRVYCYERGTSVDDIYVHPRIIISVA